MNKVSIADVNMYIDLSSSALNLYKEKHPDFDEKVLYVYLEFTTLPPKKDRVEMAREWLKDNVQHATRNGLELEQLKELNLIVYMITDLFLHNKKYRLSEK